MNKHPIKHSVVTTIPSEIFMLDMHDFLKLDKVRALKVNCVKLLILENFVHFSKPYPEDTALRRAFIEMNKWDKFKSDIVNNI